MTPSLKELTVDALKGGLVHPAAFLNGAEILRIYGPLDEFPFHFLDILLTFAQTHQSLREVDICIHDVLRSSLLDISDDVNLKYRLTSTMQKWAHSSLALRFFYLTPDIPFDSRHGLGVQYQFFIYFQEVDLRTAIDGLAEGSVELTDILAAAEGRTGDVSKDATAKSRVQDNTMDVDELL